MPLFVCEKCGCVENTALGKYWAEKERLCSECGQDYKLDIICRYAILDT